MATDGQTVEADVPLTAAVAEARTRALECAGLPGVDARRARLDKEDVDRWESRRSERHVRLWVVLLDVRSAAWDARDAVFRLARHVRQPQHRIGDVPLLRSTGVPEPCESAGEPGKQAEFAYPRAALEHGFSRAYCGGLERAHVTAYVKALAAARQRLLGTPTSDVSDTGAAGSETMRTEASALQLWRVYHRVLCLAGPGEAPARAGELASTIVDDTGWPCARIVSVNADDGHVDGERRRVHPALTLDARAATALWDDYDLCDAAGNVGRPDAVAEVLARAAVQVWKTFADEARSMFR